MSGALFASQAPTFREFGTGASTPAPAPPAPAPPIQAIPQPPANPRTAFTAVELPSLFGIVGTNIPDSTLATLTCDDPAPLFALSAPVPGLTFTLVGKVLHVEGTPATPTDIHRVVVTYMASDGSYSSLGSTTHVITIVNASEVLTVGAMNAVGMKVGRPTNQNLVALSTNYPVLVTAYSDVDIPGLRIALPWTKGSTSGSGTVTISGTPSDGANGTYTVNMTYMGRGIVLGTSSHTVIIADSFEAFPVVPSASPAPPAPTPTAPELPDTRPTKYWGPDELLHRVSSVMHFDTATGFATDTVRLRDYTNVGAVSVAGFSGEAARFLSQATYMQRDAPELEVVTSEDEALTVEIIVKIGASSGLWALPADGRIRFMPVVHAFNANEQLLWALGFKVFTAHNPFSNDSESFVVPAFVMATSSPTVVATSANTRLRATFREAQANVLPSPPGRFIHMVGQLTADGELACWFDGAGPYAPERTGDPIRMYRPDPAKCQIRIGGSCLRPGMSSATGDNFVLLSQQGPPRFPASAWEPTGLLSDLERLQKYDVVLPCVADADELRITKASRYADFIENDAALKQLAIPDYAVNPPWTDY